MTTISIENLSDEMDNVQTRALFEAFGAVVTMRLTPSGAGRRSSGFGLVEMEDTAARRAIAGLDGTVFRGTVLSVREVGAVAVSEAAATTPIPAHSDEPPLTVMRRPYEVEEVEKVGSPRGAAGDDWYRYVLVRRASRIVGFHRGSLMEVTAYAHDCAEAFNDRNLHSRNSYRPMTPRRR